MGETKAASRGAVTGSQEKPEPTDAPMRKIKRVLDHHGAVKFAAGIRRATSIIAIAVGQLDGDSKAKISAVLDRLEAEVLQAELEAAKE